MPYFRQVETAEKMDGSVVTAADLASQKFITGALAAEYPEILMLGEEMEAAEQEAVLASLDDRFIWCLDPLDGTSNFAAGIPLFGISLALLAHGERHFGWIYDPNRDELFFAAKGGGAWMNGERLRHKTAPAMRKSVGAIDLKRLARPLAQRLAVEMPFHSQRSFGSSAIEWSWLAAGRYHFYIHGGQFLWDWSAGSLILQEAGGVAHDLRGQPFNLKAIGNQSILASLGTDLQAAWQAWLQPGVVGP